MLPFAQRCALVTSMLSHQVGQYAVTSKFGHVARISNLVRHGKTTSHKSAERVCLGIDAAVGVPGTNEFMDLLTRRRKGMSYRWDLNLAFCAAFLYASAFGFSC